MYLVGLMSGTSLGSTGARRSRNIRRTGTSIFIFKPEVATVIN
jgi:hypothetical protein